jgi:L-lactate utilization protein LutB
LRALEGNVIAETDADTTRDQYIASLEAWVRLWEKSIVGRGGRFVRATTADEPVHVVRRIVESIR